MATHIVRHGEEPPWRALDEDERAALFARITPIDGRCHLGPTTQASACALPWRPDVPLVRLVDAAWPNPNLVVYYLVTDGDRLLRLNGTSIPIHDANLRCPIQLSEDNVLDYLRFFCFFTRGEEGAFYLLERPDHPILDAELDEPTQAVFERVARPAIYTGRNADEHFTCQAIVFYGDALFDATFEVQANGNVSMLDDDPIAANLPVRLSAPLGHF